MDIRKSKIAYILLHVLYICLLSIDFIIGLDLMVKLVSDFNIMNFNIMNFNVAALLFIILFTAILVMGMLVVVYLFFKELKELYRYITKAKGNNVLDNYKE
jgi:hypothetical protein